MGPEKCPYENEEDHIFSNNREIKKNVWRDCVVKKAMARETTLEAILSLRDKVVTNRTEEHLDLVRGTGFIKVTQEG